MTRYCPQCEHEWELHGAWGCIRCHCPRKPPVEEGEYRQELRAMAQAQGVDESVIG